MNELPLPAVFAAAPAPSARFCRDCHRPVYSDAARRTGRGSGCRRKNRRGTIRRRGRFDVDQEQLPVDQT